MTIEYLTSNAPISQKAQHNYQSTRWNRSNRVYLMWKSAQKRALDKGLPFNITIEDISIPVYCPVLGILLVHGAKGFKAQASPTLDRIIPSLGYVRGNIAVISLKANSIKNSATSEEIFKVAEWTAAQGA